MPIPEKPEQQLELDVRRGRPGRRTAEERKAAVLEVMSGKASVEQVARRLGVTEATVIGWRDDAIEAIGAVFRRDCKTARELERERENKTLRTAVTERAIEMALIKQAIANRPSQPGKSQK
jgi:transposase-like protein